MCKFLSMMLLAVVSGNALAEWVAVGGSDGSNVYVEPATILKAGGKVKMWHLVDFSAGQVKATGKQYMSEKLHYEYDCNEERARKLAFASHTRNMGGGAMVESDFRPQQWEPLAPGSVLGFLRKYACAKR